MIKNWQKIDNNSYKLIIDGIEVGQLKLNRKSNKSEAEINLLGKIFKIYRTGFWKNGIEISDNEDNIISKVYNEKWFGSAFVLEFYDKKLNLIIRNNPMAEWAIFEGDELLLAYGLNVNSGKVGLKVTKSSVSKLNEDNDYILDFLLWYLFIPIATENSSDNLMLTLLLTSA